MDRFFTPKSNINLEQNTCIIEGEDVKHISRVLRCKENDKLEVCDMDNNEYICEIREIKMRRYNYNVSLIFLSCFLNYTPGAVL